MVEVGHQFLLDLYTQAGRWLSRFAATLNFEPAIEATRLAAVRRDGTGQVAVLSHGPTRVLPLWHDQCGRPYVSGFLVQIRTADGQRIEERFGLDYFAEAALAASSQLIDQGKLQAGDLFQYVVSATARPPNGNGVEAADQGPSVSEPDVVIALKPARLQPLIEAATPCGPVNQADLPVLVPPAVLAEAVCWTRQAACTEVGGLLIGHLARDPDRRELFVQVTAQLPARRGVGQAGSFTFTADSWTEARQTIRLRRRDELIVGWWHSHLPRFWCQDCPAEKKRQCQLTQAVFSREDRVLHYRMFPRAYSVGLLLNDTDTGIEYAMYGWRGGLLELRGFYVQGPLPAVPPPNEVAEPPPAAASPKCQRGEKHEDGTGGTD